MNVIILLSLFAYVAILNGERLMSNYDYYKPTGEEIERARVVEPPSYWGKSFYKENPSPSIRVLTLGGSNTANRDNYVPILHQMLQEWFPDKKSLVYNGGVSGHGPTRMRHEFESLDISEWPNVIMLEFAVNFDGYETAKQLDQLIVYMNNKYKAKNAPLPSYIMFELFRVSSFYNWQETFIVNYDPNCDDKVIEHNPNITNLTPPTFRLDDQGFNHGSRHGMILSAISRFYRIPMISVVDALWPSFVRYYDTHYTCSQWPFTKDGVHLSTFGANYTVYEIIKPFFERVLSRRQVGLTDKEAMKARFADLQSKMFPASIYQLPSTIGDYSTWGVNVPDTISNILVRQLTKGFTYRRFPRHEDDSYHQCYGNEYPNNPNSLPYEDMLFTLALPIPNEYFKSVKDREKIRVKVEIGYVFSWNATLVGDVSCQLYKTTHVSWDDRNKPMTPYLEPMIIRGNLHPDPERHHVRLRETIPRLKVITKELPVPKDDNTAYALQCKKLDERLSCFTRLILSDA